MTSKQIQDWIDGKTLRRAERGFGRGEKLVGEIALQFALLNEHKARMEAGYVELTAKAAGNQRPIVIRKPATVKFKTKAGKPVSMKAIKTVIHNS